MTIPTRGMSSTACAGAARKSPSHRAASLQSVRLQILNSDAVVLGPGPLDPIRAGLLETVSAIVQANKPLLGICLGHQAIGMFFGARLDLVFLPRTESSRRSASTTAASSLRSTLPRP